MGAKYTRNDVSNIKKRMRKAFKRTPSEKQLMLSRSSKYAAAGFAGLSILVLVGIGTSSVWLKISLFCFSFCLPIFICGAFCYDIYLFLGKKVHSKIIEIERSSYYRPWSIASYITFAFGVYCLIRHLSHWASAAFFASVSASYIILAIVMMKLFEDDSEDENKNNEKGVKNA